MNFFDNGEWAHVFHHHTRAGFFTSKKEALFSTQKDKFSLLSRIDDSFIHDDVFEFTLTYPEVNGYIHWNQTKNPITTSENENFTTNIIGSNMILTNSFDGLALSEDTVGTLLDGHRGGTRFYAVGH